MTKVFLEKINLESNCNSQIFLDRNNNKKIDTSDKKYLGNLLLFSGRKREKRKISHFSINNSPSLKPAYLKYSFLLSKNCLIKNLVVKDHFTDKYIKTIKVNNFDESTLSTFSIHPWQIELEEENYIQNEIEKIKNNYPKFIYDLKNKKITIPQGIYEINQNIIFPEKTSIQIKPGAIFKMTPNISIISYGKVIAKGTKEKPIKILAQNPEKPFGVFALANEGASGSQFKNFHIEHGSETYINGIYFSGMFSAYHNDDVLVEDSYFGYSHSDDGLNFKYSNSKVLSSTFEKNSADAIDFDFMSGEISGNKFIENGNDSIDTSGSTTLIKNNYIYKSGDKCMSFGEKSETIVINNILDSCFIGVECKDLSSSKIINNAIINNRTAVNSYQKKDFFGPAHCEFYNTIFSNNKKEITFENNFSENGKKLPTDTSQVTIKSSILESKEYSEGNIIQKIDLETLKKQNYSVEEEGDVEILKNISPDYKNDDANIGIIQPIKVK